jgi:hypothetical protein
VNSLDCAVRLDFIVQPTTNPDFQPFASQENTASLVPPSSQISHFPLAR